MSIAIQVENISKQYKLYEHQTDRLKEAINPLRKKYHTDFYALNDVSFHVNKGESLGILGKNGSGKSTLLKIITGILTPTRGTVKISGKIAALLELGQVLILSIRGLRIYILTVCLWDLNERIWIRK